MSRLSLCLSFFLFSSLAAYAGDSVEALPARAIPLGIYGGPQAAVTIEAHSVRLDLPCAVGKIPLRPAITQDGTFRAEGTYGSRMDRFPHQEYPATFTGRILGDTIWVQVAVRGRDRIEQFSFGPLTFGQNGAFVRCL